MCMLQRSVYKKPPPADTLYAPSMITVCTNVANNADDEVKIDINGLHAIQDYFSAS